LARHSTAKTAELPEPHLIDEAWAKSVLPRRPAGAHKWGVGGLVVVAGSSLFAGAAALCCAAAARSGAGIVSAALPRSIAQVVVGLVPEVTILILPDGESASIAGRSVEAIEERLQRSAAMVIGPGLGKDEGTAALLNALFGFTKPRGRIGFSSNVIRPGSDEGEGLMESSGKPILVDADALNWLSEQEDWWKRIPPGRLVLTPHVGEMARLVGNETEKVLANSVSTARDAAMLWGQTVVLKASPSLVATSDGSVSFVETPPALATAGTGDVLSGSIGAFLAQGLNGHDAAGLALYVGSHAAERVARRYGTLGVVASDLPLAIAEELRALEELGA